MSTYRCGLISHAVGQQWSCNRNNGHSGPCSILIEEAFEEPKLCSPGIAHDDPSEGVPRYCRLFCPWCHEQHFDKGEWLERPHHKHLCAYCGKLWRVEPFCFGVADPHEHYELGQP